MGIRSRAGLISSCFCLYNWSNSLRYLEYLEGAYETAFLQFVIDTGAELKPTGEILAKAISGGSWESNRKCKIQQDRTKETQ
jgi:hypothetical protein